MPNPHRGEVAIPGTDYVLRYDINALCEVEEAAGENIPALLAGMEDGTPPSFRQMRLLLWGGLRSGNPRITQAEAGVILGEVTPQVAVRLIGDALTAALGKAEAEPGEG